MSKLSLAELQHQMMNYLTDDQPDIAQQVAEHGGIGRDVRLHIYKNAYKMRLQETIDNDHQLLGLYLGDDLFEQMVSGYIESFPSNSTSLRNFADNLPMFLANYSPFKDYPLLSELAHFERLLMVAFDAAEANRFNRELLLGIAHEQWPALIFRFHPSVQISHFRYNTVETWQALKQEQTPQPATLLSSTWLLWRNNERLTEFRSLAQEEHSLINLLLNGADFASLCDYLVAQHHGEDISPLALNYLLRWVDDGILTVR
jgi:hypothetical protein